MKNYTVPQSVFLLLGIIGYIALSLITFNHRQPPLFDEPLFLPNVALFEEKGLSREFLTEMDNQAPGPLFQIVHLALKPLTGLQTPGIRLVNTAFLGLIIVILAIIIVQIRRCKFGDALQYALAIMAVPMIWQVSGLALTEIPAMFFSSLSILFAVAGIQKQDDKKALAILLSIAAGLCLGLAILGRSPFLLIVLAIPVLLYERRSPVAPAFVLLYGGIALAICLPVFIAWQGLVPPKQAIVSAGGLVLWHGLLAFAYAAMFTALIAPSWFHFNKKVAIGLAGIYMISLALNVLLLHFEYAPLSEALGKVLPRSAMEIYPLLISPALATLAIYFAWSCLLQGIAHRREPLFMFLLLAGLFILATSLKVTHLFSSRYVAQAAPVFVALYAGYDHLRASRLARLAAGMVIGFLSLETYFLFN